MLTGFSMNFDDSILILKEKGQLFEDCLGLKIEFLCEKAAKNRL